MIIFVHIWAYNPKKGKGINNILVYVIIYCILVFNIVCVFGLIVTH